eukprot:TRINITY_DN44361_c0_g1_i1.p1 TRINITY_DN44361_c0_g1~~TRINITY_DN44361_c0_g1_i1.p1  ORF type:complete len:682 (-),score=96.35 TRINITY_DN44361_c0_g1_i1:82-1845(-)
MVVGTKQAELRIGAVDQEKYAEAMECSGTSGQSWYSEGCVGAVSFLCCYGSSAISFDGNYRRARVVGLALEEGDVVNASLDSEGLYFVINSAEGTPKYAGCPSEDAVEGRSLAVQFHCTGDTVTLEVDWTAYNHGVTVAAGVATATIPTVHGQPEKPTIVRGTGLFARVLRKAAEMRFGVVDLDQYQGVGEGQSWYSNACTNIATYLCCYTRGCILFNGRERLRTMDLVVGEGDVVGVTCDCGQVHFTVNDEVVASTAIAAKGIYTAVQFHTTEDAVEFIAEKDAKDDATAVVDVPMAIDAQLPAGVQDLLPADGFLLRRVNRDDLQFDFLAKAFTVRKPGELHKGRDVHDSFPTYDGLAVAAAWQVLSWRNCAYTLTRQLLKRRLNARSDLDVQPVVSALDVFESADLVVDTAMNEKFLLHGTKPETVLPILANGLNERFCGGMFGNGTYLAEEVEKIDQYVSIDADFASSGPLADLHERLYGNGSNHPGKCFYAFVCRALLGCCVHTQNGATSLAGGDVFVDGSDAGRELSVIAGTSPPVHYHTLVAELGAKIFRFREFVVFHSDRILPEFLVAFHRTNGGSVVP